MCITIAARSMCPEKLNLAVSQLNSYKYWFDKYLNVQNWNLLVAGINLYGNNLLFSVIFFVLENLSHWFQKGFQILQSFVVRLKYHKCVILARLIILLIVIFFVAVISMSSLLNFDITSKGSKNFVMCPNSCGRKYTNKYLLNRHLRYECGGSKHFSCEDCGKSFTHNFNLKSHAVMVHKKIPS